MREKVIKELSVDGFYVLATPSDYHVDYEVFDSRENTQGDDIILSGSVKWDGCSNWQTNEDCMLHACEREELVNIGLLMAECWDLTAELCPHWNP